MKALRILLYITLGILALILILGLFAKKSYPIERSLEIGAPKALVMDQVRHFRKFDKWSPWKSLDADMKVSFEGTDGEPGAQYKWEGNDDVGTGYQTLKSVADNQIEIEVTRQQPWEAKSMTKFTFEELGPEKTKVTWRFNMVIGFPWNGLSMFTDVDAGIGPDLETGLALLKKWCEGIVNKKYRGYEVYVGESAERTYLGLRKEIGIPETGAFFAENLSVLMEAVKKNKIETTGPSSGLYFVWDTVAMKTDVAVVVPVAAGTKAPAGYQIFTIPAGPTITIEHKGNYTSLGEAHMALDEYMLEKKLTPATPVLEEYPSGPANEPDTTNWLTKVVYFTSPQKDTLSQQ